MPSCQVWDKACPFWHQVSLATQDFLVCRHWCTHLGQQGKKPGRAWGRSERARTFSFEAGDQ